MQLRHSYYYQDPAARRALDAFAKQIFGLDFEATDRFSHAASEYTPFSFFDEGRVVANVSASLMHLVIEGERVEAVQIGTVASLPERRRQGLIRELVGYAHEHWELTCPRSFLFANASVLGFYQQFGYRAVSEHGFRTRPPEFEAPAVPAALLSLDEPSHRQLICRLAEERAPVSRVLGVIDHTWLLLFHLAADARLRLHYLSDEDCLVASTLQEHTLRIIDAVGARVPTLARIYPQVGEAEVDTVELSFTPDLLGVDTTSGELLPPELFVRGDLPVPDRAFRFPTTAQA